MRAALAAGDVVRCVVLRKFAGILSRPTQDHTSFAKELGLSVSRPSNEPDKVKKQSEVILVEISDTGQIKVNSRMVDIRAVRANVERNRAEKPDASVVVVAHKDSDSGILVQVIDQARQAGAKNVSIASNAT